MNPIVAFEAVSCRVDGREVLRGLDLAVNEGETLVILGSSGAGKTTALKLVNGILMPSAGRVFVEGKPTVEWDTIRLKRRTGYVIQDGGLLPHLTVAANVGLVPRLEGWPPKAIGFRVSELLDQVGLPGAEYGRRYPRELSGGQRQRVGVARALAADPPLLLFDEPFGALDPVTRLDLERQFLKWRRGLHKTSIFVTHDIREALLVGTRIGLMRNGRVEALATPAEFVRSTDAEIRTYLQCLDWRPEE